MNNENNSEINIAVIGKTGTGKSSFINAFRNLENNDKDAAKAGSAANPTPCRIDPYRKEEKQMKINLFDFNGFSDSNDTKLEIQLNERKKSFNIKEFDAVFFVSKEKFSKEELEIAKENENKNVLLFFIYNQVDKFFMNWLHQSNRLDIMQSLNTLMIQNEVQIKESLSNIHTEIVQLIKDKNVFENLFNQLNNFETDFLKTDDFKNNLIKDSIYFITSTCDLFEDANLSSGGKRIRNEIKMIFDLNSRIDLFDKFSKRLIFAKQKSILANMFSNRKNMFYLGAGAVLSIIPFLDMIPAHYLRNDLKTYFLDLFGLLKVFEILNANENQLHIDQIEKLRRLKDRIDRDQRINEIQTVLDTSDETNSDSTTILQRLKQRLTNLVQNVFPILGVAVANLSDDVLTKIPGLISIGGKFGILALALISLPIGMALNLYLTKRAMEIILTRYQEYSLVAFEILHSNAQRID